MTPEDVRAAAERLTQFHQRFAPLFGKDGAQDHAYIYVKGLMTCPERKSVEPIALLVGDGRVSALQKFLNAAPWDHDDIQAEIQEVFTEELAPTATADAVGIVGVIDESGFAKKGDHSAGVDRQYNGRLGKEDNCQVGVYLVGVAPGGTALLDHQLYLPESWCEDDEAGRERRAKAHIPETIAFQTKPEIAGAMVRRTEIAGLVRSGLDHGRRGVRSQRRLPRRAGDVGEAVCGRGPGQHHRLDGGSGRLHPAVPGQGPGADQAEPGLGQVGQGGRRILGGARPGGDCVWAREPRVRCGYEFAAVRVWAVRHGEAGETDLAVGPALVGGEARDQVLRQQRRRDDPAGGPGPSGLHAAQGRGVLRGRQELSGDGAVRDAVVDRLAPSHESGRSGSSVHHADPAGPAKKNAGADAGSGRPTAVECDRGCRR